jgi:hypothetical protein
MKGISRRVSRLECHPLLVRLPSIMERDQASYEDAARRLTGKPFQEAIRSKNARDAIFKDVREGFAKTVTVADLDQLIVETAAAQGYDPQPPATHTTWMRFRHS